MPSPSIRSLLLKFLNQNPKIEKWKWELKIIINISKDIRKSLITASIVTISLLFLVGFSSYVYAQQWDFEGSVNSYFDEFTYLCLNLEELGGLDQDNDQVDEKTKQDCKEQLENTDYLKKKELKQKYDD